MLRQLFASAFDSVYQSTSLPVEISPSVEELERIKQREEQEKRTMEHARLEAEAASKGAKKPPAKSGGKDVPPPSSAEPPPVVPLKKNQTSAPESKPKLPRTSFTLTASHFSSLCETLLKEDSSQVCSGSIDADAILQDHLAYLHTKVGYVSPVSIEDFNNTTMSKHPVKSVSLKQRLEKHEPFATHEIKEPTAGEHYLTGMAGYDDDEAELAVKPLKGPVPPSKGHPPKALKSSIHTSTRRSFSSMNKSSALDSEDARNMFVVTPEKIVFEGWTADQVYEVPFSIMNVDSQSRRVRIRPPTNPCFSVTLVTQNYNSANPIAPGVILRYTIRFAPQTAEQQEVDLAIGTTREVPGSSATATVNATWATFNLKVFAFRPPPKALLTEFVRMTPILPGGTSTATAVLRNVGGDGDFTFSCDDPLEPIQVLPMQAHLKTGQDAVLTITLSTSTPGIYERSLKLSLDFNGGTTMHVVSGECVTPDIELTSLNGHRIPNIALSTTVQFDPTCVGFSPSKLLEIRNNGGIPVPFEWCLPTDAGFQIYPVEGILLPSALTTFELFFVGSEVGEYHAKCELRYNTVTVLHTLNVSAEATALKAIVTPPDINTTLPVLVMLPNQRNIALYNPNETPLDYFIDPLEGDEHPGATLTAQQKRDRDMFRERGKDAKTLMNLRSTTRGVRFEYSPQRGTIPPLSFATVTITFTLLQQKVSGSLEVWFKGVSEPHAVRYELLGRGPSVQVVPNTMDFCVIPLHGEAEARITIQNTNDIPLTFKMQSARDMQREAHRNSGDTSDQSWYVFIPDSGTLRPWGSAIVTVYLRGVAPGPVYDSVEVVLDNCGVSKFIEVCGDVHMPRACLTESTLAIPTLYHNVPYKTRVCLQNLSSVDVRYNWLTVQSNPCATLEFNPPSGTLAAGSQEHYVTALVTLDHHHACGTPMDIFAAVCLEDDNETLIPLNITCDDVRGMSVSVSHDVGDSGQSSGLEMFISIMLKNLVNSVLDLPAVPYVAEVDLDVLTLLPGEPYAIQHFALNLQNHSHCLGNYNISCHKYLCKTTRRSMAKSTHVLAIAELPRSGFQVQQINGAVASEAQALENRLCAEEALSTGRGVAIEICGAPAVGQLLASTRVPFDIVVHANLPLTFRDHVVFRCEWLPHMRLPLTLRCKMQPLVLESNIVGLTMPEPGKGIPVLLFPPQHANSTSVTTKTLRIVNRTPRDLNVTAQLFPDRYMLTGTLTTTLTTEEEKEASPLAFSLGCDPSTHRPTAYSVTPSQFVIKALQYKYVTLDFNPKTVGRHSCTLNFVPRIIQNEASTQYLVEEFYMDNKSIGDVTVCHADPEVAKDGLKINRLAFRRPCVTTSALQIRDSSFSKKQNEKDEGESSEEEGKQGSARDKEEAAYMQRVREAKERFDMLTEERERLNAYLAKRWEEINRDQEELSVPLEVDVHGDCVVPRLVTDPPSILRLSYCQGGSPPYDLTTFRRNLTLRNPASFDLEFTFRITAPYELLDAKKGQRLGSDKTLMLKGDESLVVTVYLPWSLQLQSQYMAHAISQTCDGIDVPGTLSVLFTNKCVQEITLSATVNMPRLLIEPSTLSFAQPSIKQKQLTLLNYTRVPAHFQVVPSPSAAPLSGVPAFHIAEGQESGTVPPATATGVPGTIPVTVKVIPHDPLSTLEQAKMMAFDVNVTHGVPTTVEVSKMY